MSEPTRDYGWQYPHKYTAPAPLWQSGPTIPASRVPPDCPVPIKLTVPLAVAQENARRAFWRGVAFGGLLIGLAFTGNAALGWYL